MSEGVRYHTGKFPPQDLDWEQLCQVFPDPNVTTENLDQEKLYNVPTHGPTRRFVKKTRTSRGQRACAGAMRMRGTIRALRTESVTNIHTYLSTLWIKPPTSM